MDADVIVLKARTPVLRSSGLLAVFAITLTVTILALALAMSAIYVIQTPAIFWNNVAFTFAMILLITFPTAVVVSKMSFDVLVLNKKIRSLVRYDQITGALRKEEFFKDLRSVQKLDTGVALMMDVDNLAEVIEKFGYDATDDVLKAVAETMKEAVRDDDEVCRLGFEKFMVVLQSVSIEDGLSVARRVQNTISSSPVCSGANFIPVSVSIGAVTIEENSHIDSLIDEVGQELDHAKSNGHNRLSFTNRATSGTLSDGSRSDTRIIN